MGEEGQSASRRFGMDRADPCSGDAKSGDGGPVVEIVMFTATSGFIGSMSIKTSGADEQLLNPLSREGLLFLRLGLRSAEFLVPLFLPLVHEPFFAFFLRLDLKGDAFVDRRTGDGDSSEIVMDCLNKDSPADGRTW